MKSQSSTLIGKKRAGSNSEYNKYNLNAYLPVCSYAEEIITIINSNQVSIISGRTGCGKTTQIPQLIYNSECSKNKPVKILITQPRRLAAISIANRLSKELKFRIGDLVGYQVGLNSLFNKYKTRIIVKTTGLFLEEIIHEKNSLTYTHIILDEVHERDINIDFLLILIKKYISDNPNVKVILMSATISTQLFQDYFSLKEDNTPKVPIFEIKEHIFNITKVYIEEIIHKLTNEVQGESFVNQSFDIANPSIDESIFHIGAHLIKYLHLTSKDKLNKGILVFLPGFGEIQSFSDVIVDVFDNQLDTVELLILHSNISE